MIVLGAANALPELPASAEAYTFEEFAAAMIALSEQALELFAAEAWEEAQMVALDVKTQVDMWCITHRKGAE